MKRIIPILLSLALLVCVCSACSDEAAANAWTKGVVADGVYTNETLHMSFQIPEGWIEATEEETRSILGASKYDDSTIYDVLIGTVGGPEKMYVTCMDMSKVIGGGRLTQEKALQEIIKESPNDPVLSAAQYGEIGSLTVCGLEYSYVDLDVDGEVFQRIMMHKLSGKQLVMLGVVAASEADLEYYMAHFTSDPASIPAPPEPSVVIGNGSFSRGVVTNKQYVSTYLGICFTATEDWVFASDAELSELMGISFDLFGEDVYGTSKEFAEAIAKQALIYDMVAAAPDGSNVQIMLENLSVSIGGTSLSEIDYVDILRTQLDSITDLNYKLSDTYTSELAGKTFTVIDAEVADGGLQQQFWLLRVDKYMLCITFTSMSEDAPDFVSLFSEA